MLRTALVLGLVALVSPLALDMYLPALPAIAEDLNSSEAAVQATLTFYFIAFGLAQLVYGPLSDQFGRKLPLYAGLGIFVAGSAGVALSVTVEAAVAWRFVQGFGGAVVMVVPRAVVRDLHTGAEATRLTAAIMLVISVSPMLAPLAGSAVIALSDWRGIFWVLAALAGVSALLTGLALPETLAAKDRVPVRPATLWRGTRTLLASPSFMGLTFIGGFGMASFLVFIASASFVYAQEFGLTPAQFSLAFALNAVGFFSASQAAAPLGMRFGIRRVLRAGVTVFFAAAALLLLLSLAGLASLPVIMAFLFAGNAGLGLVLPASMVLALEEHGDIAGLAASLGGTLQMVAGGVMIAVTGRFFDGTALPMIAAIALCGLLAMAMTVLTLGRDPELA